MKKGIKEQEKHKEIEIEPSIGYGFKHTKIKVHELIATILEKKKVKNVKGKYAGGFYWVLAVKVSNPSYNHINKIFVGFEKLKNKQIWEDIENNKWVDRKYVIEATRTNPRFHFTSFWVVDWQEVKK